MIQPCTLASEELRPRYTSRFDGPSRLVGPTRRSVIGSARVDPSAFRVNLQGPPSSYYYR